MSPSEDQTAGLRRQEAGRLTEELRDLPSRSTQELKQPWQTLLGTPPPGKLGRDLLIRGFEHQGKRYSSLTQIADEVTGAHWSGPRFFGLTKPPPTVPSKEARHGS